MSAREKIWCQDWAQTRQQHDPKLWRRVGTSDFVSFGQYSARSMAKWMALRGHLYEVILHNGQRVLLKPKPKDPQP